MKKSAAQLPAVLYEDPWMVALDKPSGLLVIPDRWDEGLPNLLNLVHQELSPDYFNVHRLDRDTSGVILFAKTTDAMRALAEQFETKDARKTYVAFTRGCPAPERGTVDLPILPDPKRPGRMIPRSDGKESHTQYEVLERFACGVGLLRLTPLTGRTHQLRVHLAAISCAIVGDELYGNARGLYLSDFKRGYRSTGGPERPLIARLALHAQSLALAHPFTGAQLAIESPWPREFTVAAKNLRKYG